MNAPRNIEADLADLGMTELECVARGPIADARPAVAEGFSPAAPALEAALATPDFTAIEDERLARHGVRLHQHLVQRATVAIDAGAPLRVARGPGEHLLAGEGLLLVDVARFQGPTLVERADRSLQLLLRRTGDRELECAVVATTAAPSLGSDVARWASGDSWLEEEVRRRTDAFGRAVAVGLVGRLKRRAKDDERALLRRILDRKVTPGDEPERAWARALPLEAARWLERRAIVALGALSDRLTQLTEEPAPRDASWVVSMIGALRERDELDAVQWLLRARGASGDLDRAVARVDDALASRVRGLPTYPCVNEHLARARALGPAAWWAERAREV